MSIKITKSKEGGRRVKLSARFSDVSGHIDILNMLQALDSDGWSQPDVMQTALMLLHEEWRKNPIHPLTPSAEYVSSEMLEMVKKAQDALDRTNEVLQLVVSGALSNGDAQQLQQEISKLRGSLDIDIIEGAGSYAGEVSINDSDDDFGEW